MPSMTTDAAPPKWFTEAVTAPAVHRKTEVRGCQISYRVWGSPGAPGVVLVHGGGACAAWWDHVAPQLSSARHVVALDLSGHGDSGWRPAYSLDVWAEEVFQVANAAGIRGKPAVVGHSRGGRISIRAAERRPKDLAHVVIVDTTLSRADPANVADSAQRARRPTRRYRAREEALMRFRPLPEQRGTLPYVLAHVARQSIRRTEGGWTWKFDPRIYADRHDDPLRRVECPVTIIRGEFGVVRGDVDAEARGNLNEGTPVITLPGAGHHVMLDKPLALVEALDDILRRRSAGENAKARRG